MPTLSPHTLTKAEQAALLAITASHPRDHLTFSFALGTGLRLAEIVGLDPEKGTARGRRWRMRPK